MTSPEKLRNVPNFGTSCQLEASVDGYRKTTGAAIGAIGAQVVVVGAFYGFGDRCCADQLCINDASRCLFGLELLSYWASVGAIATLVSAAIGALVAGDG